MYFFKLSVVMFTLFLGLTSCQENSLLSSDTDRSGRSALSTLKKNATSQANNDQEEGDSSEEDLCFDFQYPITIVLPNGDKKDVNSEEELMNLIDSYYDANPNAEEDPTLEYPVTVTVDGEQQTVTSDDQLEELLDDCWDEIDIEEGDCPDDIDMHMDCYELVYPVTVQIGDRTETISDEAEMDTLWVRLLQDSMFEDFPEVQYPYDVKFDDGTTLTIDSDEALDKAEEKCFDSEEYKECFAIKYPVQIQIPGGDIVTVNSEEELYDQIDAYFQANPEAEEEPDYVYPVTVVYDDGTEKAANSEDEIDDLYEACDQAS